MTAGERAALVLTYLITNREAWGYVRTNPMVMLAQADLETNGFQSRLLVEDNNAFGMRAPNTRALYTRATDSGFAVYGAIETSVVDYLARQKQFGITDSGSALAYMEHTVNGNSPTSGYVPPADRAGYIDAWMSRLVSMPTTAWYNAMKTVLRNAVPELSFQVINGEPIVLYNAQQIGQTVVDGYTMEVEYGGQRSQEGSSAMWMIALLAAMATLGK